MRLLFSFLFISFFFNVSFSQELKLSPQAEVSVLTFGPGTNLNDAFGHSAFRIKDRTLGIDVVYGYGGYDFEAPNFILKFTLGKLDYLITKNKFSDVLRTYSYYDRTIEEQKLNLQNSEKQKLYDYLIYNYKPENKKYLYDFFYDNCATKIRDVINIASVNSISFNVSNNIESKTFRNLIHEHVGRNTWGSFGIDIALGSTVDRPVTNYEEMFLPKYIFKNFEKAKISDSQNLVSTTNTLYKSKQSKDYASIFFLVSPIFIMSIVGLLIIFITYKDYKTTKRTKWLDVLIFSLTGVSSIVLLFLWFGTNHNATAYNYNLLWAFPFNILAIRQVAKLTISHWFHGYLKFTLLLLFLMGLHWMIGVQTFALGILPIFLALLIRYAYLIHFYKK